MIRSSASTTSARRSSCLASTPRVRLRSTDSVTSPVYVYCSAMVFQYGRLELLERGPDAGGEVAVQRGCVHRACAGGPGLRLGAGEGGLERQLGPAVRGRALDAGAGVARGRGRRGRTGRDRSQPASRRV